VARIASTGSPGRSSRAEAARPTEIRAVIFDLDGVLLDTESILRRVDAEVIARHGGALTDDLRQRALGLTHESKDRLFVDEPPPTIRESVTRSPPPTCFSRQPSS